MSRPISVVPLGAGQDVGRSCVLVTIAGCNIMFDVGMHMGYNDQRRFPDFSYVSPVRGDLTSMIDCVIVSHFHLDHCGALPYFSEVWGYNGPIFMTHPTKAIVPILLEDYRKITVERKGDSDFFTQKARDNALLLAAGVTTLPCGVQNIHDCMRKVIAIDLHQTIQVGPISVKAYYAGHVLGAAMFAVSVAGQTVVYTGDYNMTADRHLGSAWIDRCLPDVLITESTYATTIRDSKRCRERNFLKKVHACVERGGKVLIPVFALGRAQELCILLETFWERTNLKVPIYFAAGLTERANQYYKLFVPWTNEKIKGTFVARNMFDFKHILPFERAYATHAGPMVVFATPGMLHAGLSLQLFRAWAPDPKNMLIMPGFCVAGTVGAKVLAGEKIVEVEPGITVDVRMAVENLSFSAHADAKGIMQLIRMCGAKAVVLVHGEASKMGFLQGKIQHEFGLKCYYPANGMCVDIATTTPIPVQIAPALLRLTAGPAFCVGDASTEPPSKTREVQCVLLARASAPLQLLDPATAARELGTSLHVVTFEHTIHAPRGVRSAEQLWSFVREWGYTVDTRVPTPVRTTAGFSCASINAALVVSPDNLAAITMLLTWNAEDNELAQAFVQRVLDQTD